MASFMNVSSLPWHLLSASASVDVLHLAAGLRPAIRLTSVRDGLDARGELRMWGAANQIQTVSDDQFTWMSTDSSAATLLSLDRSVARHEIALGTALGYPLCCCLQVARVGEANIDAWAIQIQQQSRPTSYRLSDIGGFDEGLALLSHVPCKATCRPSLAIAKQAADWIQRHSATLDSTTGTPWSKWCATLAVLSPELDV
jgi:hypothetical protein